MLTTIEPNPSLFDQLVTIEISGLSPFQNVTVGMWIDVEGKEFVSNASFIASKLGIINSLSSESVGGSFTGVNRMGLFSFLIQAPGQREGLRFVPAPTEQVLHYEITVIEGHHDMWNCDKSELILLTKATCYRMLMDPSKVDRILIVENGIRGSLFIPKNIPPGHKCPGIIDVYGTAGGLMDYRAAILASHGFIVLALAYFNYPGIPTDLNDIDLTYFDKAIDWLSDHPKTLNNRIGMLGISYGAVIALYMATVSAKVSAVVSINGDHVFDPFFPMKYRGVEIPNVQKLLEGQSGFSSYYTTKNSLNPSSICIHPIEQSQAKFLMLCSEEDGMVDSVRSAELLSDRLKLHNKGDSLKCCVYEAAGHLLEPPYMPFCKECHHKILAAVVDWGGKPVQHVEAQVQAWKETISFFTANVGQPINISRSFANDLSSNRISKL